MPAKRYTAKEARRIRERLRMTQAEFAQAIGCSVQAVQKWDQGKANPGRLITDRLARLEKRASK